MGYDFPPYFFFINQQLTAFLLYKGVMGVYIY
ncbi:hypothetical protein VPHD81_0076 [Vibrio phage D81]